VLLRLRRRGRCAIPASASSAIRGRKAVRPSPCAEGKQTLERSRWRRWPVCRLWMSLHIARIGATCRSRLEDGSAPTVFSWETEKWSEMSTIAFPPSAQSTDPLLFDDGFRSESTVQGFSVCSHGRLPSTCSLSDAARSMQLAGSCFQNHYSRTYSQPLVIE